MPVRFISGPEKNIGTSTRKSFLNNVHQPIWFVFRREDFQIVSASSYWGNVQINSSNYFVDTDGSVGDYVKVASNVNEYNGTWKILAMTTGAIILDLPYISAATGYFNMLGRKNWYYKISPIVTLPNGLTTNSSTLEVRQGLNDEIHVNVAPILKPYVLMNDTFNYSDFAYSDTFESNQYTFDAQEFYKGSETPIDPYKDVYHFINSINQPRYRSGSNMEYFMFGDENNLIKWLTPFKNPTCFVGFPFCMSFINFVDDRFPLFQHEVSYGVDEDVPVTTDKPYLTRTMISNQETVTNGTIDLTLRVGVELGWVNVSETITVDVDKECHKFPVYLNWLDTTGGRAFWLFDRVQTVGVETAVGDTFEPLVNDLATQQGDIFEVERTAGNRLVLTTYTTIEKAKGIKSMLYSLNVLMLVNPETWGDDGVIWEAVRPLAGSYQLYNTNETHTSLTVTIELIATNIQGR